MKFSSLSCRQSQIFNFIKEKISTTGSPPTRAEIARFFGFKSVNSAELHVKALARKGYIKIAVGVARGIQLTEKIKQYNNEWLPLIYRPVAGTPILAQKHIEKYCKIDSKLFQKKIDYLLKIDGESMKDISIFDGDLLAVHQTIDVQNGQIVVARVGGDITVKRFERKGDVIRLSAENKSILPITLELDSFDFTIDGIVVGVIRNINLQ